MTKLSRRRFLTITAAVALGASARAATPQLLTWRGRTLGAEAEIRLYHPDAGAARMALASAVDDLERLEKVFNLFDPASSLSRLNRDGQLDAPPLDLVRALDESARISSITGGAFDATVQPVWALYADTLARTGRPPNAAELHAVRPLVDWRGIEVSEQRIRFARRGMAVTLNGMAQGYITDRVAERFTATGFPHVLVDLGELRAPANLPDGSPWSVAVRDPDDIAKELRRLDLAEGALATSEAFGSSFRTGQHDGHIIDPANLTRAVDIASVTVRAPTATIADLLSTAIAVGGPAHARDWLSRSGAQGALIMDGRRAVLDV